MEAVKAENPVSDIAETTEKGKTIVYLLPSEASHTIVQIKPSLKISSILPPTERSVSIDDNGRYKPTGEPYECKIKTPTLMLTQILLWWKRKHDQELSANGMCKCFNCNISAALLRGNRRYKGAGNPYFYHWRSVDLEKCKEEYLHGASYAVANTDGTYICWGKNEYPPSLRIANTIYWMSHLNNSPGKFSYDRAGSYLESNKALANKMIAYSEQFLKDTKSEQLLAKNHPCWGNHHSEVFGKEYLVTSQKTAGVLVSFDAGLKETHEKAVVDNGQEVGKVSAIIGFARRDAANGVWVVDTNDGTIRLRDDQVAVR